MESLIWGLKTLEPVTYTAPILLSLALCFAFMRADYVLLVFRMLFRKSFGNPDEFEPAGERPTGLIVIPTLLRNDEDFVGITTTVQSCGENGYPSDLHIVVSIDGRTEFPELYAKLEDFMASRSFPKNVHLYVTGTETRLGKMMAVEAGVSLVKAKVAAGEIAEFPRLYFSVDGDGTLGDHALERLAARLTKPHWLTGNPARVVSGKICIRPDLVWRGWRSFFSVEGQLYLNVAREFVVSNVSRHNWKLTPQIGIPGALYCTWSDVLLAAPHYMSFMQALKFRDWVGWWLGKAPPTFSARSWPSLPEALTGASDDTCIAFMSSLASWQNGKLSFDAPRTPLHAFFRFLHQLVIERSHGYEPEARVYTYSPPTLKGLWRQRVRWNSSRFECAGRFWRGFWYHWEIGAPTNTHLFLVLHTVIVVALFYVLLPLKAVGSGRAQLGLVIGYLAHTFEYTVYTVLALSLERERRKYWRVLLCLPVAAVYDQCINMAGCIYGVSRDLLFFGNWTNFAPEWTLIKSNTARVALLFRTKRFLSLCLRSVLYGDVPFGAFWFGWTESEWAPSGFTGWTTGEAPRAIVPLPSASMVAARVRSLFRHETPAKELAVAEASEAVTLSVLPLEDRSESEGARVVPFRPRSSPSTVAASSVAGAPVEATAEVPSVRRAA